MNGLLQLIVILYGSIFLIENPDATGYVIWCGFLLLALVMKERR